jgi:glyoxylase-like metal-dependent hydrolase (beta-lactamase superfamily II)
MKVVAIPNGAFLENCYLVIDEVARQCAIVDPGEEAGLILHKVEQEAVQPVAIWLTHAHIDHVLGVPQVREATGAPVFLHPDDRLLYDRVPQQAMAFGLNAQDALPPPDRSFAHGDRMRVGGLTFNVRQTPGHSPGSVSLVGEGVVFAGDVLFQGSIGRTDLPGGDFDRLIRSIERELLVLPDSTIVYSGHGPHTTIGAERRANPFLTGAFPVPS